MQKTALSPFNEERLVKLKLPKKVTLYDSTLRDGEQMPLVSFTLEEKVELAEMLASIGVKQIEAGFPAVSEGEKKAIKKIASLGLDSEILVLARCCKEDIDAAVDCGVDMAMLFMASSDLHLKFKYGIGKNEAEEKVLAALEYAKSRGIKFSFSTEDSTRTDLGFLLKLSKLADKKGARRIGLADTTGCALPSTIGNLVSRVKKEVKAPVSVHLHNDFGLALANALGSVENGASAVATTVNGIGERAGNVPLEQMVVALEIMYGIDTGIDLKGLKKLCNRVSQLSGVPISKNHPWVGENVFRHESGIHVSAIMKNPFTYECVPPGLVGAEREFTLGKHSGKTTVKMELDRLGINLNCSEFEKVLGEVKKSAQRGKKIDERTFKRIVKDSQGERHGHC
jgi:methanogen homocitrate synthase